MDRGHVYLSGFQYTVYECVWKCEWEGDTVPCPCGPSRCTSVHMSFWSHTHLAYPEQDRVASHETPSQMNAHQIHVCCKDEKDKTVNYIPLLATTLDTIKHHIQAESRNRLSMPQVQSPLAKLSPHTPDLNWIFAVFLHFTGWIKSSRHAERV